MTYLIGPPVWLELSAPQVGLYALLSPGSEYSVSKWPSITRYPTRPLLHVCTDPHQSHLVHIGSFPRSTDLPSRPADQTNVSLAAIHPNSYCNYAWYMHVHQGEGIKSMHVAGTRFSEPWCFSVDVHHPQASPGHFMYISG